MRQRNARPWKAAVPVVCIGNPVAGGAGKTPVALDLAARLLARGKKVHFLTRGYGGRTVGPLLVAPRLHAADMVGDEPLLLAEAAPTWVAADRVKGAMAAVRAGAELIIMDDGFQNPALFKDLSLLVVDGGFGFGNGRVMPAGPLREPVAAGLKRASAVVVVGRDQKGVGAAIGPTLPLLAAGLVPVAGSQRIAGRRVLAFSGIGRPEKFFETLGQIGCEIVSAKPFPDHHPFREREIRDILAEASLVNATPVTTRKDWVRLPSALRRDIEILDVRLQWDDESALESLLNRLF